MQVLFAGVLDTLHMVVTALISVWHDTLLGAVSLQGYFTEYERSHYIYDLNCDGNESSIWNCSYDTLNRNNCNEQQDASVYCQGSEFY